MNLFTLRRPLVLLLVLAGSDICSAIFRCPADCQCTRDNQEISCKGLDLPQLPRYVARGVKSLTLKGLRLHSLDADVFMDYMSLQSLEISGGRVSEIHPKAFSSLTQLLILDLSDNEIGNISVDMIVKIPNLQYLFLSGNQLEFKKSGPILRSSSLRYLDISSCGVQNLQQDAFTELPSLVELNIEGNPIECLTAEILEPLKALRTIVRNEDSPCITTQSSLRSQAEPRSAGFSSSMPSHPKYTAASPASQPSSDKAANDAPIDFTLLIYVSLVSVTITITVFAVYKTIRLCCSKPRTSDYPYYYQYQLPYDDKVQRLHSANPNQIPPPVTSYDGYEIPRASRLGFHTISPTVHTCPSYRAPQPPSLGVVGVPPLPPRPRQLLSEELTAVPSRPAEITEQGDSNNHEYSYVTGEQ